jgi:hypothetical protein
MMATWKYAKGPNFNKRKEKQFKDGGWRQSRENPWAIESNSKQQNANNSIVCLERT